MGITATERDAWLKAKNNFVGASELSALFGENPYMTPLRLWGLKTGRIAPEPENRRTPGRDRGGNLEIAGSNCCKLKQYRKDKKTSGRAVPWAGQRHD